MEKQYIVKEKDLNMLLSIIGQSVHKTLSYDEITQRINYFNQFIFSFNLLVERLLFKLPRRQFIHTVACNPPTLLINVNFYNTDAVHP